jgi:uncharacterized protein YfaS (alpha-2-macroglobulin family)
MATGVYVPSSPIRPSLQGLAAAPFSINYNAASGTYNVPLPPGALVFDIHYMVTEAFTTSGSNASLTIGDTDGADVYAAANDISLETVDTVAEKTSADGQTKATGDYYPTGDNIKLVFTAATAGATAGKIVGAVLYTCISNGGIPTAAAAG